MLGNGAAVTKGKAAAEVRCLVGEVLKARGSQASFLQLDPRPAPCPFHNGARSVLETSRCSAPSEFSAFIVAAPPRSMGGHAIKRLVFSRGATEQAMLSAALCVSKRVDELPPCSVKPSLCTQRRTLAKCRPLCATSSTGSRRGERRVGLEDGLPLRALWAVPSVWVVSASGSPGTPGYPDPDSQQRHRGRYWTASTTPRPELAGGGRLL
ncbi:hypothetical protein AAFF_G00020990 [Aldrovandia affinis]|uniref:Uncharacterized protein n=1 Tax=Aldrovandia affinis TaxID=143900 RepID=A0AAD7S5Q3_9TELE|nr:hypothetical protein AAFF_G00020990 [Aldrovandia affinis]